MEYKFSDRASNLKPSAIREIFKYASDPEIISLSAGNPSPDAFPVREIAEISSKVLAENPISVLQYSVTEGYAPLRAFILDYMKTNHSTGDDNDDVIITTGAQQIMDLCTKSLVNEGDVIICEAPTFTGSLNTFRSYNAKLVGVKVDNDGMNIAELEEKLKENPNTKFIYTIPNFQNPSGVTMSLEKRKDVYSLAKKYGVLIIEDNPYGDLRYTDKSLPNIKSFDKEEIVIYAGSFSKVVAPGLRVAYCICPKEIHQKLVVCKQGNDVHTNIWSQYVCYEFISKYNFGAHLEKLRKIYSEKAQFCMNLLDKYCVPAFTYNKIDGGLFIWCDLPSNIDMQTFCKEAIKNKVCVVPGTAFLPDEAVKCNSFRINFTTPTDEQLEKGIKILGELAHNFAK